jgi:hypothetical protein
MDLYLARILYDWNELRLVLVYLLYYLLYNLVAGHLPIEPPLVIPSSSVYLC